MAASNALIKKHPVLTYYILTFAISFGAMLLAWSGSGIPPTKEQAQGLVPQMATALAVGPLSAGLLMTGLVAGRAGYRDLLARLLRWRVGFRWYAVALLTAPVTIAAILSVLSLSSPDFIPAIVNSDNRLALVLAGIGAGLGGGICEEIGWTGFAMPRLRQRYGILATGLLMGVLWGAWHFPPFWEGDSFSGGLPTALLLGRLFTWLLPYRVLMVWVYDRTESVLLVILMHASLIASSVMILMPPATGAANLTWILIWAAVLWVVVAAVVVANHGHLESNAVRLAGAAT